MEYLIFNKITDEFVDVVILNSNKEVKEYKSEHLNTYLEEAPLDADFEDEEDD